MKTIDKKSKGKWIKFKQGVFNTNLVHMLEDGGIDLGPYPNKEVQNIIKDGDLYCYHITDTSLTPTPHIMIKTKGRYLIEEIYGSTFKSTVSKELLPILKRKLRIESKFLNKHHYLKMISNEMKLNKLMNKKNYTKADLKFLYEIEEQIEILGDSKEVKTKIKKCLDGRNMRQDLITIFGCSNEELAIGQNEFTSNTKYLYGDLDLHEVFNGVNIILPKVIIGSLNLTGLTATENIQMPDFVRRSWSTVAKLKDVQTTLLNDYYDEQLYPEHKNLIDFDILDFENFKYKYKNNIQYIVLRLKVRKYFNHENSFEIINSIYRG